jgi:hypothetical protein
MKPQSTKIGATITDFLVGGAVQTLHGVITDIRQPSLDINLIDPGGVKTCRLPASTAVVAVMSQTIHRE